MKSLGAQKEQKIKTKQNLEVNRTMAKRTTPSEDKLTMKYFNPHDGMKQESEESITRRIRALQEPEMMQPYEQTGNHAAR